MPLEIKFVHSPDTSGVPVEKWNPNAYEEVYILVQLDIGQIGKEAADIFSCVIATPEALMKQMVDGKKVLSDRALIVVNGFDWPTIYKHLSEIVERCSDENQITEQWKLQRFFLWEYEDYVQCG